MTYVFATRWPPYRPLIGGEYDYARNLALSLSQRTPVAAIAFESPNPGPPSAEGLNWTLVPHGERSRWRSLLSPLPNVAARNRSGRYLRTLIEKARGAEAVFVDFIAMAWVMRPLRMHFDRVERRPVLIMVSHNHEHSVRLQMTAAERSPLLKAALTLDTWKAGRLEREASRCADGLAVQTVADGALYDRRSRTPWITATPAYEGRRRPERRIDSDTPRRACMLGNYAAHHKRMALVAALDVLSAGPHPAPIDVVGGGDSASLAPRYPQCRFLGFVDDVDDYLAGVRLGVAADTIGGGFKNRILTLAANRVPILALNSALHGMGFQPGVHYEGADTLEELNAKLVTLIDDLPRLNGLQEAAFAHIASSYDWADRGRDLQAFVERLRASIS